MDEMKYLVLIEKPICLLEKNQYTFDVDQKSTKTEIKKWIEGFFGVKVIRMNSHRLSKKRRRIGPLIGHSVRYKQMIITLRSGYSILLFRNR